MPAISGRVVQFARYGGPEVLEVVDATFGEPGPESVLVEVRASGVNPVDWKVRNGWRSDGIPLSARMTLGQDAAGTVIAVGSRVREFSPGDDVIGFSLSGAYATHVVAMAAQLCRKPAGLDFAQAAALGVPVATAYQVLRTLKLAAGEILLVHAGAGAVGQATIQLGREWGARVIATAGDSNHALLRALGAEPVNYGAGLLSRVAALAPEGVHVVVDGAGTPDALEASLTLVHDRRRIGSLVVKEWREQYGVSAFSAIKPGYLDDDARQLRREAIPFGAQLAVEGRLLLPIQAQFALDDVAAAHRLSETGHATGKIVLVPEVAA